MSCPDTDDARRIRDMHKELTGGADIDPSAWHDHTKGALAVEGEGKIVSKDDALWAARRMCIDAGVEDPDTDPRTKDFIEAVASGEIAVTEKRAWAMLNAKTIREGEVADRKAISEVKNTGKEGTDIPPLVVEVRGPRGGKGPRLYTDMPGDRDLAATNSVDALFGRLYNENGEQVRLYVSTTTAIGEIGNKAQTLMPWADRMAAEKAREIQDYINSRPTDEEKLAALAYYSEVVDPDTGETRMQAEVRGARTAKTEGAANRGTDAHAFFDRINKKEAISDEDVPDELKGYVKGRFDFGDEYEGMEVLYSEATVRNRDANAMGTVDAIVRYKGKNYILDYKTNKDGKVYAQTGMQLAMGANAEHIVYPDGRTEPMPEIHGGLAVGIAPDGKYNVYLFETDRDGQNYNGFKAAVQAWYWNFTSGKGRKPLKGASQL